MRKGIYIVLFLHIFTIELMWAQSPVLLPKVLCICTYQQQILSASKIDSNTNILNTLSKYISQKQKLGFLACSVDTIYQKQDTLFAEFYEGQKYIVKQKDLVLKKKKKIQTTNINKQINDSIEFWMNKGYPYTSASIQLIKYSQDSIIYDIATQKNNFVVVDSIRQQGKKLLSDKYLLPYLDIRKGEQYNHAKIQAIDNLINRLPFVRTSAPSRVFLTPEKAFIDVFLQKKKTNQFDFILGVLPKNEITGKILVTGEAKLALNNAFKRGEQLALQWKRLQKNTQTLKIDFTFPYLLKTPIGIGAGFYLERRDSTWVNLRWKALIPTQINVNSKIEGIIEGTQTIALNVDTNFVKLNKRIPSVHPSSMLLYGIQYHYYNVDNLLQPQKGYMVFLKTQVGNKKIKSASNILAIQDNSGFDYSKIYDSINNKKISVAAEWKLSAYYKFKQKSVLKTELQGKVFYNKNILRNELYRIGGATVMRGFDEEVFLASSYNVATLEYRYLLQKSSYFFLFTDIGYAFYKENQNIYKNIPIGFGAGMSFESKAGIFALSYAMGKATNIPLDFRNAKIHISYITVF
jgi:hypothetical protein